MQVQKCPTKVSLLVSSSILLRCRSIRQAPNAPTPCWSTSGKCNHYISFWHGSKRYSETSEMIVQHFCDIQIYQIRSLPHLNQNVLKKFPQTLKNDNTRSSGQHKSRSQMAPATVCFTLGAICGASNIVLFFGFLHDLNSLPGLHHDDTFRPFARAYTWSCGLHRE